MPEEFFDSQFAARMVRLMQLKRGRGPAFLSDEIIPVIDLSSLLSNMVDPAGDSILAGQGTRALIGGVTYSRYVGPSATVPAGNVNAAQILNPVASGRRVIVMEIHQFTATTAPFRGSRHNTALTNLGALSPLIALKSNSPVSVVQIRWQNFANAAAVQAAITAPMTHYHGGGAFASLINVGIQRPVLLEEGEGFAIYPVSATGGAFDAEPAPLVNVTVGVVVSTFEFDA